MIETLVYLAALLALVISLLNAWLAASREAAMVREMWEIRAKLQWCEKQLGYDGYYDYSQDRDS